MSRRSYSQRREERRRRLNLLRAVGRAVLFFHGKKDYGVVAVWTGSCIFNRGKKEGGERRDGAEDVRQEKKMIKKKGSRLLTFLFGEEKTGNRHLKEQFSGRKEKRKGGGRGGEPRGRTLFVFPHA